MVFSSHICSFYNEQCFTFFFFFFFHNKLKRTSEVVDGSVNAELKHARTLHRVRKQFRVNRLLPYLRNSILGGCSDGTGKSHSNVFESL